MQLGCVLFKTDTCIILYRHDGLKAIIIINTFVTDNKLYKTNILP